MLHADFYIWKHILRYWPVARSFDVFFFSAPEQTVEQTLNPPVIWDAIALIMTSLLWVYVSKRGPGQLKKKSHGSMHVNPCQQMPFLSNMLGCIIDIHQQISQFGLSIRPLVCASNCKPWLTCKPANISKLKPTTEVSMLAWIAINRIKLVFVTTLTRDDFLNLIRFRVRVRKCYF